MTRTDLWQAASEVPDRDDEPAPFDGNAALRRIRDAVGKVFHDDGTEPDWQALAEELADAVETLDNGLIDEPWRLPDEWRDVPDNDDPVMV